MVNFQDALKQKGDAYGALWADEGGDTVQAAFEVYLNERASQSQSFNY